MTHTEDLALADQHIGQAEEYIGQQFQRIERLTADGYDTIDAKALLLDLEWSLLATRRHRQLILDKQAQDEQDARAALELAALEPPERAIEVEGRLRRYPGLDRRVTGYLVKNPGQNDS